ncbi:hypothetical protein CEXT_450301 [Caerostris extrusa]|uniref:Uncharacterized protein n=1 Tax=Caerostris extrusa TaxID=172846 RepID=A0AAV4XAH8_CAEEX|nr:hypothetical protein CEXT_450301 [Caerostris extrusa]
MHPFPDEPKNYQLLWRSCGFLVGMLLDSLRRIRPRDILSIDQSHEPSYSSEKNLLKPTQHNQKNFTASRNHETPSDIPTYANIF